MVDKADLEEICGCGFVWWSALQINTQEVHTVLKELNQLGLKGIEMVKRKWQKNFWGAKILMQKVGWEGCSFANMDSSCEQGRMAYGRLQQYREQFCNQGTNSMAQVGFRAAESVLALCLPCPSILEGSNYSSYTAPVRPLDYGRVQSLQVKITQTQGSSSVPGSDLDGKCVDLELLPKSLTRVLGARGCNF